METITRPTLKQWLAGEFNYYDTNLLYCMTEKSTYEDYCNTYQAVTERIGMNRKEIGCWITAVTSDNIAFCYYMDIF